MKEKFQLLRATLVGAILLFAADAAQAFYNPVVGRWLNRDPIGEEGGKNVLAFVSNAPTVAVDDKGLVIVGFYGADVSYKWPNSGNQKLESISAALESRDTVLRPEKIHGVPATRPKRLYQSRDDSTAFQDLLGYLDTNNDGIYNPPCDKEEPIRLFGWSWGGASAVELARRIKASEKFRRKEVALVAVIDPVSSLRWGNHAVPDNVLKLWNRYQKNGEDVLPFGLDKGEHLNVADPSNTIEDQAQLDPDGTVDRLNHVTIIWWVEHEFVNQF